jgi:hypothetical protein
MLETRERRAALPDRRTAVADEAEPIAYSALAPGVPVLSQTGTEFGTVERVLEVPEEDLFDGIVVSTRAGLRFVDADQVGDVTTEYVRCTISDEQAAALPEPSGTPVFRTDPGRDVGGSVRDRLGRWFGRGRWTQDR